MPTTPDCGMKIYLHRNQHKGRQKTQSIMILYNSLLLHHVIKKFINYFLFSVQLRKRDQLYSQMQLLR